MQVRLANKRYFKSLESLKLDTKYKFNIIILAGLLLNEMTWFITEKNEYEMKTWAYIQDHLKSTSIQDLKLL